MRRAFGQQPATGFHAGVVAEAIDLSVGLAANGPAGDILRAIGPVPGTQLVHQHRRAPQPAPPTSPAPGPGPLGPVPG